MLMRFSFAKIWLPLALLMMIIVGGAGRANAQGEHDDHSIAPGVSNVEDAAHSAAGETAHAEGGHEEEPRPVFEPEHGTWFNGLTRAIFGVAPAAPGHHPVVKYDFLVVTALLWALLAVALVSVARKRTIRPEGKAASFGNTVEAAVEAFQDYLIGVMGEPLGRKYTAFISAFFFTILVSNWLGLVPGMLAPSSIPAIPIALAIVGFVMVHVFAIKEAGLKSWFMHFVGEPIWLAPLNFPLHIVGELIKPLSLSLRLLCNVFGEEQVVATLTLMAVTLLPIWLPIPLQFPMLILGTFFGFLQALVFSTLLAIYISIFATHHDEHDHPSTEHAVENDGDKQIVGHPAALTVGA